VTVSSYSSNTDPNGEAKLLLNEFRNWSEQSFQDWVLAKLEPALDFYDATEIFRGLDELSDLGLDGYTSLAQLASAAGLAYSTIAGIIDYVTVDGREMPQGKVNLNTAPMEVITLLPGSSEAVAHEIVARRDQQPFTSLGEVVLLLAEIRDGPAVFDRMIDHVTTKSSTFIVDSMGWTNAGHTHRTLSALVQRKPDMVFIVCQSERDFPLPALPEEPVLVARR
jgi:type II secretory pathway component PulK